jgi:hypothetical protein
MGCIKGSLWKPKSNIDSRDQTYLDSRQRDGNGLLSRRRRAQATTSGPALRPGKRSSREHRCYTQGWQLAARLIKALYERKGDAYYISDVILAIGSLGALEICWTSEVEKQPLAGWTCG